MSKAQLYAKIHKVMQEIEYLQKDDNVSTGAGNGSYKAISEEKVTQAVRAALVKHGLIILPVEQDHKKDVIVKDGQPKGYLTTVDVKYEICDIETGESKIIVSSGTGVDTQDKGVGKAMTYSYKYMMLRTFAIPTGDDPDKVSSDVWDETFSKAPQAPQTRQQPQSTTITQQSPAASTTAPRTSSNTKAKVYKIREELQWGWPDLNQFAADVLGRQIKFINNDVKTEEEWKQIEAALLVTKNAASA